MSSFIPRNLTEIEAVAGCTFACICNTVFRMFSCLQINCQPFYLRQLLRFHPIDWLIEIYLQTEGQGTHHKMVALQPNAWFSPLFFHRQLRTQGGSRLCNIGKKVCHIFMGLKILSGLTFLDLIFYLSKLIFYGSPLDLRCKILDERSVLTLTNRNCLKRGTTLNGEVFTVQTVPPESVLESHI